MPYDAESEFYAAERERMEGSQVATMSDAHREWHLNSGVPMGQPGCPQDACHPVYDDEDMEPSVPEWKAPAVVMSTNRVKCGNRKAHGADVVYHESSDAVRACYGGTAQQTFTEKSAAPLADPGTVTPDAPFGTTHVTLAPQAPAAPKPERISVEEMQTWRRIPVGKGDTAYYALRDATTGEVSFFRVRRPSTGKYKGRTYVDQQSSDNFLRMEFRPSAQVLSAIAKNPMAAAVLYGQKIERCAMCHRSLTDDKNKGSDGLTSLERGIGPDCAKKVGLV